MIETVRRCFQENRVLYTKHSLQEMGNEPLGVILDHEINELVIAGEIVQGYPEDRPYPSCLIGGYTRNGRPLHVVCSYDDQSDRTIVITAYEPDPKIWETINQRRQT